MQFVHLHCHNEYSQLDGMGKAEEYASRAANLGFKYLGLTNHGNIDGLIKFQKACKEKDITPVLGCELYIVSDIKKKKEEPRRHICVYVKDNQGWRHLTDLLTFANLQGFYYKPIVDFKILLEKCKGLVISTACPLSFLWHKEGKTFFENLNNKIGSDLYLEAMPHNTDLQKKTNKLVKKIHKKYGNKIVATNDCHYVKRGDWKIHEVLLAIQRGAKWKDKKRWKFGTRGFHLKKEKEMIRTFEKAGETSSEEWLENTIEVAEKCSQFKIKKRKVYLPPIRFPEVEKKIEIASDSKPTEDELLYYFSEIGHINLFGKPPEGEYNKRLYREFKMFKKKSFSRCMLIVYDLVSWCHKNNIMVGPGRGSVGGSLIAYLTGITTVDPIEYDLSFERFITEDRIDLPDIDLDFEKEKRHLVIKYLEEKFGSEYVASISSFSRMKSRAIIREVGKVFEVPDGEIDRFAKMIDYNDEMTLASAIEDFEEGQELKDKYPFVVKAALTLEGQIKNYGKHAAGVVVSKRPITKGGRCNLIERNKTHLVNWEKDDTEYMGLFKLDILSLNLLSILNETRRLIEENHNTKIEFGKIPLEDKKVLEDISAGKTTGSFQIGTWATSNLIREMGGVNNFREIAAAIALVRPGPMQSGMTQDYIERKETGKWEKKHDIYESITKETYGVLVYQEQVMSVISKMAGLPYSTADQIRKIIGKKRDRKEFKKYEKEFIKGCLRSKTFDRKEAKKFWNGLQEWASYGFNKAHSIEYALLGYWCSWLKHYYPTEFICASLTFGSDIKKEDLITEAYDNGLVVELPKVGISDSKKWIAKGKKLHIPFIEVKGIGPVLAEEAAHVPKQFKGLRKFYSKEEEKKPVHKKNKLREILEKIHAYDPAPTGVITEEIQEFFPDFTLVGDPSHKYKKLWGVFLKAAKNVNLPIIDKNRIVSKEHLTKLLNGDEKLINELSTRMKIDLIREKSIKLKKVRYCKECDLREEASAPVPPSSGRLNIIISGEAPGYDEDRDGEGFVGRSGEMLWKSVDHHGFERSDFHVTNINKCYPSKSQKPSHEQIKICTECWFQKEIRRLRPRFILAFGNTNLFYFTGKKAGITEMSGKTTWHEQSAAWVTFCIHPAAVLHNRDNKTAYNAGMQAFFEIIKTCYNKGEPDDIPF